MSTLSKDQILEVLRIFEFGDQEGLFWRDFDGILHMYVLCSDVFFWGSADMEEITPENLPLLHETREELHKINQDMQLDTLFCARVRKIRPQGALYKYLDEDTWHLFDDCGPERDVGIGNPHPQPERTK